MTRTVAQLEADLLRAASERDELQREVNARIDNGLELHDHISQVEAVNRELSERVQRLTDELDRIARLAEATEGEAAFDAVHRLLDFKRFGKARLRRQVEALPTYGTWNGIIATIVHGDFLDRDAVLQLLTPQSPET